MIADCVYGFTWPESSLVQLCRPHLPAPGWWATHGVETALVVVLAGLGLAAWRLARKRARALAQLQLLAENIADLVFRTDSDGTIV